MGPVDIFLRTSICHLTCVKFAPENQTAGGAKPSLFCNMPRFWDTLYFSVKKVFYIRFFKRPRGTERRSDLSLANSCQVRPSWGELLQKSASVEFVENISVVTCRKFSTQK